MDNSAKEEKHIVIQKLGNAIRVRRNNIGLTQEQLAERSGIDRRTISDIENAKTDPEFYTLFKITRNLQFSIDTLFHQTPDCTNDEMKTLMFELSDCSLQELNLITRLIVVLKEERNTKSNTKEQT